MSLQIVDLGCHYLKDKFLFKHISIDCEEGTITKLMGANGVGKTTLLYCIANVIPTMVSATREGMILIDGNQTNDYPLNQVATVLSLVTQYPDWQLFFPDVESEITFGAQNLCLPEKSINENLQYYLEAFHLFPIKNRNTAHLSFGEKKLTAIASICCMQTKYLILDEPFAGLSSSSSEAVASVFKDLVSKGKAILFTGHDTILSSVVDKVIELK